MDDAIALLHTKLAPPAPRPPLVARPALLARLEAAARSDLCLLSAPAGSGKTTLVAEWLSSQRRPGLAWVSLDPGDNDPRRFWRYVFTALQAVAPEPARAALEGLHAAQHPDAPALLTAFINDLAPPHAAVPAAPAPPPASGLLVLEDYQAITNPAIHAALAFLLDHLPPGLRLLLLTRSDPPLPLARLRASNQVSELRAADLRFTPAETSAFLQQAVPHPLAPGLAERLAERTEGWAAGLRLAALALHHRPDPAGQQRFLDTFTGSHRPLLDYLAADVLAAQPEHIQSFLLAASQLDRLSAALCDALITAGNDAGGSDPAAGQPLALAPAGAQNSALLLEQLERRNLFLEPLDGAGQWYRFHPLFAEAMRSVARQRLGEAHLRRLAQRAARWYEANAMPVEAVEACLSAHDFARAAHLIETLAGRRLVGNEYHTLLRWIDALPAAELQRRPALCLVCAQALLFTTQADPAPPYERMQALLAAAEVQPADAPPAELPAGPSSANTLEPCPAPACQASRTRPPERSWAPFLRPAQSKAPAANPGAANPGAANPGAAAPGAAVPGAAVPGAASALRALIVWRLGDFPAAFAAARRALPLLPPDALEWRGISLIFLGWEAFYAGRLIAASQSLIEARALFQSAGNRYGLLNAILALGEVHTQRAEPQQAGELYRQALRELERAPINRHDAQQRQARALLGLAGLAYARSDLPAAADSASQALALAEALDQEDLLAQSTWLLARLDWAAGRLEPARTRLAVLAARLQQPLLLRQVHAWQTRLALAAGDQAAVQRWSGTQAAQGAAQPANPRLPVMIQEQEALLLARIHIVQGRPTAALPLLESWLTGAQANGRTRSELEARLLQALANAAAGQPSQAHQALSQALALAPGEHFLRLYLDEGPPLEALLQDCPAPAAGPPAGAPAAGAQAAPALACLRLLRQARTPSLAGADPAAAVPGPAALPSGEQLSQQEGRVLGLLAAGLSNPEIAQELVVSVNTVKTHVKSIYRKLEVNNRGHARRAARRLKLET